MEDMGDIKVFRKNLMIISIINILVFIFAGEIKEINVFGLISLKNIESYKILSLLLVSNFYFLIRYNQHSNILTSTGKWNDIFGYLTYLKVIKHKKYKITYGNGNELNYDVLDDIKISPYDNGIGGSYSLPNSFHNGRITFNEVTHYIHISDYRIHLNKYYKIIFPFIYLKSIMQDEYFTNKNFPYILSCIGIFLIEIKIFYLIFK